MTPENLDGFMPMIGDAMLSDEEEVQISVIRLLSAIIRVDLPAIKDGAGVYISQCMAFIRSCPSTNAELAQASLKLLSSILREKKLKDIRIKDASMAYLLDRVAPDLEEPDRQGVTFNFIKAVLSRKIVIDGVYDIMEEISRIMVTNQARPVRESCRGIYFQFVTEYPQKSAKAEEAVAIPCFKLGIRARVRPEIRHGSRAPVPHKSRRRGDLGGHAVLLRTAGHEPCKRRIGGVQGDGRGRCWGSVWRGRIRTACSRF